MSRRGGVAMLVITLWLAGVAALFHREVLRDPADRLALAGHLVEPGTDFYAVHRDGEHTGFSSFTVDTTETGIELNEYMVFDVNKPDQGTVRLARRLRTQATRGLKLVSFLLEEQAGESVRTVAGEVQGDSVLTLVTRTADGEATERIRLEHPVLPSSAVTFALALSRTPRVGRSYDFATLDQFTMRPITLRLRVTNDSTLVFADSAAAGSDGRWIGARADTVRAWQVEKMSGGLKHMWVDASGRLVHREFETGVTEHRTAYELAYLNWSGSRIATRRAESRHTSNPAQP